MIYVYRYSEGDEVDVIERDFPMGEAPAIIEESGRTYRRVYTPPQPVFYGSGFYKNEYSKSPLMKVPRKQRI